jgi:hypothetical protein
VDRTGVYQSEHLAAGTGESVAGEAYGYDVWRS